MVEDICNNKGIAQSKGDTKGVTSTMEIDNEMEIIVSSPTIKEDDKNQNIDRMDEVHLEYSQKESILIKTLINPPIKRKEIIEDDQLVQYGDGGKVKVSTQKK